VDEGGVRTEWSSPVEVKLEGERPVPFGDAQYRGHLLVRATGRGTLHVVNRVFLEDYLKGVVPSEMGPRQYDEVEALKAQAVAARSYALRRKGDFAAEGYDLCATPRCQVYGGVAVEQQLSSRAVDETAGQVLLWKGRVAEGLFTSTCGGRTENAADVFPSYASADVPYLASVACFGETPATLTAAGPAPKGPVTMLGARGLALLASLGKKPGAAGLLAVRNAVRARLGLPPRQAPHPLWPASAYAEIVEAAGFGDIALLIEPLERESAPPKWPEKSRAAYALLLRFQLGNGTTLPTGRALKPEEAAGIWANLLARLGDFEDVDGRLVSSDRDGVTVKSTKGRATYRWHAERPLFLGGADAAAAVTSLEVYPGDRVRVFVRGPEAVGLLTAAPASAGTYDRESSWIHWTRRFTAGELAAKLRERDPSRGVTAVTKVAVLERGASGRAKTVRVSTDKGPLTLAGLEVRFSLGLPENLFTVVEGRAAGGAGVFTFYGRGWGHGVGLCQNGAFGMALAGHDALEILARYYAGAAVGPVPEGPPAEVPGALR
jgi:stage II sporulation protein D